MFINIGDRTNGETSLSHTLQTKPVRSWVLLVRAIPDRPGFQVCVPGELGCMGVVHFAELSLILGELPSKIRSQFMCVLETKKPQVLKIGEEKEMNLLYLKIQFVACTCMFYFEVVQSL